ncbi:MAG: SDR family oxidoreductase [Planctomycetaceae bacterium]|jgi:enoyl-[acyl-carrier protein] reductase I|nr:SDR family oxidoreductase [Planctomycetaceae bacterium]
MTFLQLAHKRYLIFGVANKKSVACHITQMLLEENAEVVLAVRDEKTRDQVAKIFPKLDIYPCNVENEEEITAAHQRITEKYTAFDGLVHSLAFADFSDGLKPFHETGKKAFLQAVDISCFSLIAISRIFADLLTSDASVVTVSISTTRMASENYGYMAPIKAALDSSLAFLAKSFSNFSNVRFNAVAPGLLKTSASAGIPGYLDSYLYAEEVIPRKKAVTTEEAAATAVFLLSPRSGGINAQKIVVDAGMEINYFDKNVIRKTVHSD